MVHCCGGDACVYCVGEARFCTDMEYLAVTTDYPKPSDVGTHPSYKQRFMLHMKIYPC
jgi:hypothetical protein